MPKLHASSIAFGALLSLGLFVLLGQASPQSTYASWGPPKQGVLNILDAQGTSVPAGGSGTFVMFSVPSDRWVTLTRVSLTGGNNLRIAELYAGNLTVKAGTSFTTESPVGLVFRPGSQVVAVNLDETTPSGPFKFTMLGYQTRD